MCLAEGLFWNVMGIQEGCVWLRACYAESFRGSGKGSKQNNETDWIHEYKSWWFALSSYTKRKNKKLVLRFCAKWFTLVYSMNIYYLKYNL